MMRDARKKTKSVAGLYKMRTVTRLTGFSAAVLRAWELRFDFLAPARAPKGHRFYTEDDLAILRFVKAQLDAGRSIGEVALPGRDGLLARARAAARAGAVVAEAGAPAAGSSGALRPSGSLAELRERVVRAAVALDATAGSAALDAAFAAVTPERAVADLIEPAAREIGRLWAAGECSVAGEHLVSGFFVERMHRLVEASRSASGPLVLCACPPDELHELGSLVVAYHLSRHGFRVLSLGPNLPLDDLERACRQLSPAAVSLSVAREALLATHLPQLLAIVRRLKDDVLFVLGGQGATAARPSIEDAGGAVWPAERRADELAGYLAEQLAARATGGPKRRRQPQG